MVDGLTGRLALICGGEGSRSSIGDALARLGWDTRAVGTDPRELSSVPARLWVVDLQTGCSEPEEFLEGQEHSERAAPLLAAVGDHDLRTRDRELARLVREWPAPAEIIRWPSGLHELRVRLLLLVSARKAPDSGGRGGVELGRLQVDHSTREARWGGERVELTHSEFEILHTLAESGGRAVSKAELSRQLHGGEGYNQNLIECHVGRLRAKLLKAGMPDKALVTVRRGGYRLAPELL